MRKVCIITGTRAEWGILSSLARKIDASPQLTLQIIATNMHLSPEFGLTYREIEEDGFRIDRRVEMLLSSDTPNGTAKSIGLGTIGFADAYEDLRPDIIVILGDRYEMLAAASAALVYKIPVAHLYGGEITEGAYDDSIRHALTKMSHLHFTATEDYRNRVVQLGEEPERVFHTGGPGVENALSLPLLSKEELVASLGFDPGRKYIMVTYHPVTMGEESSVEHFENLLEALEQTEGYGLIFTYPNSDTSGRELINMINRFVERHPERAAAFKSLGIQRYLSALKYASAVVGNSSSGILEAPCFGIPTLNIGSRQRGRTAAESVTHCGGSKEEIKKGLELILSPDNREFCRTVTNPYWKPGSTDTILEIIRTYPLENITLKKFHDIKL